MFTTLKLWYYRNKARRKLIAQYIYVTEVNKLLENYLTKRIMDGGSAQFIEASRKELITKQNEIKENAVFIEFLRSSK